MAPIVDAAVPTTAMLSLGSPPNVAPHFRRRRPGRVEVPDPAEGPRAPRTTSSSARGSSTSPGWHPSRSPALRAAAAAAVGRQTSRRSESCDESERPRREKGRSDSQVSTDTSNSRGTSRGMSDSSSGTSRGTPTPPPQMISPEGDPMVRQTYSQRMVAIRQPLRASLAAAAASASATCGSGELDAERCGCCTKDDFWALFDGFKAMDRRHVGSISRSDFFWALRAQGTNVDFQRAVNRAKLSIYFHKTAQDISLDGFIRRALPLATENDLTLMLRWADLRKVYITLTSGSFSADESEMRKLFMLIREDCVGDYVSVSELLRARIVAKDDLVDFTQCNQRLNFDAFCGLILEKYYWGIGSNTPNNSENDELRSTWRTAMRLKFQAARDADNGSAQGCSPSLDSETVTAAVSSSSTLSVVAASAAQRKNTLSLDTILPRCPPKWREQSPTTGLAPLERISPTASLEPSEAPETPPTSAPMAPVAPAGPPLTPPRPKTLQRTLLANPQGTIDCGHEGDVLVTAVAVCS